MPHDCDRATFLHEAHSLLNRRRRPHGHEGHVGAVPASQTHDVLHKVDLVYVHGLDPKLLGYPEADLVHAEP